MSEPTAVAIVTPEERAEREREGATLAAYAHDLAIADADTFTAAATWVREVATPLKAQIRETFRPRIEQAHALHKGLLADERRFLGPVEDAERIVRGKLADYDQDQARLRREAEAAAQRERERLEREARAQAAAVQRALHAAAEDRRLAEAVALEAAGDTTGAAHLIAAPLVVPVVAPAPVFQPRPPVAAPPRVEGVSFRDEWDFRITDEAKIPREYLVVDQKKIRGVVKAMRQATRIPGVEAFPRRVSSVRTA